MIESINWKAVYDILCSYSNILILNKFFSQFSDHNKLLQTFTQFVICYHLNHSFIFITILSENNNFHDHHSSLVIFSRSYQISNENTYLIQRVSTIWGLQDKLFYF